MDNSTDTPTPSPSSPSPSSPSPSSPSPSSRDKKEEFDESESVGFDPEHRLNLVQEAIRGCMPPAMSEMGAVVHNVGRSFLKIVQDPEILEEFMKSFSLTPVEDENDVEDTVTEETQARGVHDATTRTLNILKDNLLGICLMAFYAREVSDDSDKTYSDYDGSSLPPFMGFNSLNSSASYSIGISNVSVNEDSSMSDDEDDDMDARLHAIRKFVDIRILQTPQKHQYFVQRVFDRMFNQK